MLHPTGLLAAAAAGGREAGEDCWTSRLGPLRMDHFSSRMRELCVRKPVAQRALLCAVGDPHAGCRATNSAAKDRHLSPRVTLLPILDSQPSRNTSVCENRRIHGRERAGIDDAVGLTQLSYDSRHRGANMVGSMEREKAGELEGQTSIDGLLNESVGVSPIQMVLPLHVQVA